MSTNPNYLGPLRNRFPLNLYQKLPLVNALSLNQSETVFEIKFWSTTFWTYGSKASTDQCLNEYVRNARKKEGSYMFMTTYLRQHGLMSFIILYLKFWLHRLYFQNAAECTILRPEENKILTTHPTAFSLSRVCMYAIY
jgi:hypothetical protein